jgi:hypothetical protein
MNSPLPTGERVRVRGSQTEHKRILKGEGK